MSKLQSKNGYFSIDGQPLDVHFTDASIGHSFAIAQLNLTNSGLAQIEETNEEIDLDLACLRQKAEENTSLAELFGGTAMKVILPQTVEEDPGLFFSNNVGPAAQTLKAENKITADIKYKCDVPLEYRLTPTPGLRHQQLLDKLEIKNLNAWFMPSIIGLKMPELMNLMAQMPSFTSIIGFNDGWPIIIQYAQYFQNLCLERALWFSGITSETSGIGFCLETSELGELVLQRRSYDEIQKRDIHGFLIS